MPRAAAPRPPDRPAACRATGATRESRIEVPKRKFGTLRRENCTDCRLCSLLCFSCSWASCIRFLFASMPSVITPVKPQDVVVYLLAINRSFTGTCSYFSLDSMSLQMYYYVVNRFWQVILDNCMPLIHKHLSVNQCDYQWFGVKVWKMMAKFKFQNTLINICKHAKPRRIPDALNSERMSSHVIEAEFGPSDFSEEPRSLNAQNGTTLCAVCHRWPAAFVCDSCEQNICDSCTLRSSLLPLSRFCSDDCKNEAETATDHVRHSDPYTQRR